jgi:hypothetical protein
VVGRSNRLVVACGVADIASVSRPYLIVATMGSNTSIERTCHGRLRLPRHAAHVER